MSVKYDREVTNNYASSLGAAIRNALDESIQDADFSDAETAGKRLTELLKRMQEKHQFTNQDLVDVFFNMASQSGVFTLMMQDMLRMAGEKIESDQKLIKKLLDKKESK